MSAYFMYLASKEILSGILNLLLRLFNCINGGNKYVMLCICDMRPNLMARYVFLRYTSSSETLKFINTRSIEDFNTLYKQETRNLGR